MPNPDQDQDTAFARGGQHGPFGPSDDSIDFRCNGDFKLEVMKTARARGFANASEFIKIELAKAMWGEAHVVSLMTRYVLGNGASVGQVQDEGAK